VVLYRHDVDQGGGEVVVFGPDPQLKAPHDTEKNSIPLSHPTHKSKKE